MTAPQTKPFALVQTQSGLAQEAVRLWQRGFDTMEIAQKLDVKEGFVYNNLHKWRAGK